MISAMDAFVIELLKKDGYTYDDVLTHLHNNTLHELPIEGDVELFKTFLSDEPTVAKKAFEGDYKIKFLTLGGLKNLMNIRLNVPLDAYEQVSNGLLNVQIDEQTEAIVRGFASSNWVFERNDQGQLSILVP